MAAARKAAARKVETRAETRADTKADTRASLVAAKVKENSQIMKVVTIITLIHGTGMHPHGSTTGPGSSNGPKTIGSLKQKLTHLASLFKNKNVHQDASIFHGFSPTGTTMTTTTTTATKAC